MRNKAQSYEIYYENLKPERWAINIKCFVGSGVVFTEGRILSVYYPLPFH